MKQSSTNYINLEIYIVKFYQKLYNLQSPNPDTIIRVLMTFKGLETTINVKEQQLETPNIIGFVAIEWGGTEIR